MKTEFSENTLTLFLEGRIDSNNAPDFEKASFDALAQTAPESLVLDAEALEYISSAGLRVLLKLRKRFVGLKIVNVSSDVYEILDMTGFTEMIDVEKAYRLFDVSGCELIGEGANGWVYRATRELIVKVYKSADSLDAIKRERELSRTAFVLGIPTAIPYDVVKVGDTYGSVFELLDAKSFDELMIEDASNLEMIAQKSIEIAKLIHSTKAPDGLPRQRDIALGWAKEAQACLSPERYEKLTALIKALPEDGYLIHGDFHIKNIMLMDGETLLIDMDTLSTGHPVYELANMFNAYKGFGVTDKKAIENFLGISVETTHKLLRRSLELYFDTEDDAVLDDAERKAALIGYLRIMRRAIQKGLDSTPEGKELVEACRDKLNGLIDTLDTLTF